MTEFLLIRHGINDWVNTGRLAGWTPGIHLNQEGKFQTEALGERLANVRLDAIYASPLERTMETAEAVAAFHPELTIQPLDGVGEVRFGNWQGAKLSKLRNESLWETVQVYPSRAHFPGGESIRQAQARAVDALETLVVQHPNQRVAVVSHSDVIKLIVAHYIGAHVDFFQRIEISPASVTVIQVGQGRPYIIRVNDTSHVPHLPHSQKRPGLWQRLRALFKRE
jgi:probable phosphoglycerate mutase